MTKSMKTVTRVTGIALLISAAVVLLTLIISAIAGNCTGMQALFSLCNIVVAVFGAAYLLTGATKNPGSKLFKIYLILNAVSSFLLFVQKDMPIDANMIFAIYFGGFCVLAMAHDLGEVKSFIIAIVIAVLYAIAFFLRIASVPTTFLAALGHIARLVIALSVVIIIWAKYADKKARGTK